MHSSFPFYTFPSHFLDFTKVMLQNDQGYCNDFPYWHTHDNPRHNSISSKVYHHFINSQYQTHTPLHEKHHEKAIISKSLNSFSIFQPCLSSPCFFLKAPVVQLSHYPSPKHILHCCMILDFHHCESEATPWTLSLRPGEASTSFKRFCTCCANTIIASATFTLICAR